MTGSEKTKQRKLKILKAATKIFAVKGFQETTIAEIAKAAGASEASVYDYYATKENLLFSIPRVFIQKLHESLDFHLKLIRGSLNKLHATLYMQLLFYKEHPEFTSVLMLILKHNPRFLDTEAHEEIRGYLKHVDKIIQEGVDQGEFKSDIGVYYVRAFLIGALEHIVINWLMRQKPSDLMDACDPLFELTRSLVTKQDEMRACPFEKIFETFQVKQSQP